MWEKRQHIDAPVSCPVEVPKEWHRIRDALLAPQEPSARDAGPLPHRCTTRAAAPDLVGIGAANGCGRTVPA